MLDFLKWCLSPMMIVTPHLTSKKKMHKWFEVQFCSLLGVLAKCTCSCHKHFVLLSTMINVLSLDVIIVMDLLRPVQFINDVFKMEYCQDLFGNQHNKQLWRYLWYVSRDKTIQWRWQLKTATLIVSRDHITGNNDQRRSSLNKQQQSGLIAIHEVL